MIHIMKQLRIDTEIEDVQTVENMEDMEHAELSKRKSMKTRIKWTKLLPPTAWSFTTTATTTMHS